MKKGYFFILITALLYSTQEISAKLLATNTVLDPFQVIFIVFLFASIILVPFTIRDYKKRKLKFRINDLAFFLTTGTLCIPISLVLLQIAVGYTSASAVAVIISANAVFTAPFAYFILKEKITKTTAISLTLTLFGVVVIMNPMEYISGLGSANNLIGIGLSLIAAIAFSLYTVISATRINYYGGIILNCFSFICGEFVLFLGLLLFNKPFFQSVTIYSLILLVYMGVFIKALGYICYIEAIKHTSAITASTVFLIKPALAPLLAFIILGEVLSSNILIGICLVFLGAYLGYHLKKGS